jgi:hypothetical protein
MARTRRIKLRDLASLKARFPGISPLNGKEAVSSVQCRVSNLARAINVLVPCSRNKHIFRCDQNGPPARREEGAYLNRYVTDEQGSRRPIFIATLWAAAGWLFFRVARSSRIDLDMLVARALKNSQLACGERHAYFGNRTLV